MKRTHIERDGWLIKIDGIVSPFDRIWLIARQINYQTNLYQMQQLLNNSISTKLLIVY